MSKVLCPCCARMGRDGVSDPRTTKSTGSTILRMAASKLKDSRHVAGRARSVHDRERRRRQHEFPPMEPCRGLRERFQIFVVEDGDAERRDHEGVKRVPDAFDKIRTNIVDRVTANERHTPRLN